MDKGTYLLILQLTQPCRQLQIGKLGKYDFAAGFYLYVGSAFGAGGLPARLAYHRRQVKQHPHWHIDYLRPYGHLGEIWSAACEERLEAAWCQELMRLPELRIPIKHFGASDTALRSHLFYTLRRPSPRLLHHLLVTASPLLQFDGQPLAVEVQRFTDDT